MWMSKNMGIGAGGVAVVLCVVVLAMTLGDKDPVEQLNSEDPAERLEAVERLAEKGDAAALARATADMDATVAYTAVLCYARLPKLQDTKPLTNALEDQRPSVRQAAVSALGQFRLREQVDPKVLVDVLRGPRQEPAVRAAAAESLGRLDRFEAMPALVDALSDSDVHVRAMAKVAIVKILGIDHMFNPTGSEADRRKAIDRIRKDWPGMAEAHRQHIERMKEKEKQK